MIVQNDPVNLIDPYGLFENPLPNLPTFSESFPQSTFVAPVVAIVAGGIESALATSFGVGAGVLTLSGPENRPEATVLGAGSIEGEDDSVNRIQAGINAMGSGYAQGGPSSSGTSSGASGGYEVVGGS